ncbi:proline racemase family protein [Hamadaea sp. NPDC051192]|uniref:proline racemase family protein n=1 Tax=Hamadaea sp. NPDC051192 TaxID=3154940 RepID=UPI003433E1C8
MDHGVVRTVDYHTGGEPFRIVTDPGPIAGETVAARRVSAMADPRVDGLRRLLCFEPRGHADMYGGFLVPPDDDGAHLGVLFWHKDGFSTACGHGTIALGAWAVRSGLVPVAGEQTDVVIDVPSGRVTARVHVNDGRVSKVDFVNVPSYLIARDVEVGEYRVDVSFGGAIYAQVDAASLGLKVTPESHQDLIAIGRELKWALNDSPWAKHPSDDRLSGVYGTIIYEELGPLHQRNVTIFADGELDRSPCGSGTAARVATLAATGRLHAGQTFVHDSIVGSRFTASIASETTVDGFAAVVPCVTGTAYLTGEHTFVVDPDDDLPGFVLR